jgi:hypothetical protein
MPVDRHQNAIETSERPTGEAGLQGAQAPAPERFTALRLTRALGALALLVVGGVHFEQYTVADFSVIPTIGPLFLVNFIAATGLGLVLLVPIARTAGLIRLAFDSLSALAGIGLSIGAFAGLLVSEHTPLFGFMEQGYRLEIVIALAAEAAATLLLAVFLVYAIRWAHRIRQGKLTTRRAVKAASAPSATRA